MHNINIQINLFYFVNSRYLLMEIERDSKFVCDMYDNKFYIFSSTNFCKKCKTLIHDIKKNKSFSKWKCKSIPLVAISIKLYSICFLTSKNIVYHCL